MALQNSLLDENIPSQWKYLTAYRDYLVIACRECPERPYLSIKFPHPERRSRIIARRVRFTFDSRDQGWADGEEHWNGTHKSSYSYVEARVIDPNGYDRVPRETLTVNRRAHPHYQRYAVDFDSRNSRATIRSWDGPLEQWPYKATPSDWLGAIRSGDEIRIVPQAIYQAWACYIERARIEVWIEDIPVEVPQRGIFPYDAYINYGALDVAAKEIRLVVVEPMHQNADDGPPLLRIVTTKLSDPNRMRYEALSYCWGKEQEMADVILSRNEISTPVMVHIPRNLHNALHRLQQKKNARKFWIDLLCINQEDVQERNSQVSMMDEIYSSADSVTVWLGEQGEIRDTRHDLCSIKDIAQKYTQLAEDALGSTSSRDSTWKTKVPPYYEYHHREAMVGCDHISHYGHTFLRPWFRRVWVLQEVWNASSSLSAKTDTQCHDVRVLCGDLELPWWMIMQTHSCLSQIGFPYRFTQKSVMTRIFLMPEVWNKLFVVQDTDKDIPPHLIGAPGPRLDILTVVLRALELDATDPRDRIFALISFGQETHDTAASTHLIMPNYEKSVAQVYTDFTIWWIQRYKSLKILSAIHALRHRTWIDLSIVGADNVDVSTRPTWTLWHDREINWNGTALALDEPAPFQASGTLEVDVDILTSDFVFPGKPEWIVPSFRGIRIGEVSSHQPFRFEDTSHSQGLYDAYVRIFDPSAEFRVWDAPKGPVKDRTSDDYRNRVREGIQFHLQAHKGAFGNFAHAHESWLPCHGYCVFKTMDGHVGLHPSSAQTGDIVVILYGGKVPYLLRYTATAGVYSFVGECYLEGFMRGEALDTEGRDLNEEIFRLI